MTTNQYIETLNTRFKSGISREHSYRGDLESLIRELVKGVDITNEPSNVTDCGYKPAQKWLKDRRGRDLSFEDILHYQKIIVSLFETDRLMKEIDLVGVE